MNKKMLKIDDPLNEMKIEFLEGSLVRLYHCLSNSYSNLEK